MSLGAYNGKSKSLVSPFESSSSFSFDGTDEAVDTGIQPDFIHTNATMSYWVNMDDLSGAQLCGTHNAKRFYLGFYNATAGMGVQDTNNLGSGTDLSSYIAINQWHHIAMVAEGGTATFYLDGVARDTLSYTQNSANNPSANLYIGAITNSGTYQDFMHASISDFAIFSSALTAREVDAIYNNGRPGSLLHHSTLHAHYRMGEGTLTGGKRDGDDNFLFDQSTNGGLGSELITNGTFNTDSDWSHSGTTISGGTANFSVSSGGYIFMSQSESFVNGSTYQLTATVNGTASKEMRFMDNGANNGGLTTSNGVVAMTGSAQKVSITFTANANSSTILIGRHTSSGDYSFTVDNVSVKEIQNVGTISGATALPAEGAELLTGLTNGRSYPFNTFTSNGRDITAAIETSGDFAGGASNQFSIVDETTYKVTFDLTYNSGSDTLRVVLADNANGAATLRSNAYYTTTNGVNVAYLTGTATDTTAHLQIGTWHESDLINFSATNITLQELTEGVPLQTTNLKPISSGEKSLTFDGTDEFIDTGFQPDFIHRNATVSFWCNMANFSGFQALGCYSSGKQFYVGFNGTAAGFALQATGKSSTDISAHITANLWHHIALVADNGTATYYVDGVARDTLSYTPALSANPDTNFYIGAIPDGSGGRTYHMEGSVSDVAVWDAALSASAVKALYNAGQSTHLTVNTGAFTYKDNLQVYYKMGSATVPSADNTNGFLFDQTSPGVGPELMKADDDLYIDARWYVFSDPEKTYPGGTAARFTNPTSGGWNQGGRIFLTTGSGTHALTANMETGSVYKLSFDFLTDDSDAVPSYNDGTSATSLPAGSGSKTFYFTFSGNAATRLEAANVSASKFVEFSKLSLAKVNGHTGTITSATIQTEAPKQIYALPPVANTKSLNFSTDDYLQTQVDATAQPNNESRYYSWWLKSTTTARYAVFDHGTHLTGALQFNDGNKPTLLMAGSVWQQWNDNSAQDDGNWHHWVVKIKYNDITGCELWCDGVKQTKSTSSNTGSMNVYTTGIRIARSGSYYLNGNIDEFSIHEDLTEEGIRALFNRGRPIDVSKARGAYDQTQSDKLLHWWRMGDATSPAADGTNDIIFQGFEAEGSELLTNGDFETGDLTGWTSSGSTVSVATNGAGSNALYISTSGASALAQQTVSGIAGTIKVTFDLEVVSGGGTHVVMDGIQTTFASSGSYTMFHTSDGSTDVKFLRSGATEFYVDNVSVKQVRGQYLGKELTIANPYDSSKWTTYGNIITNPSTTSIRAARGASGGSNSALQAALASNGILTGNVTVGKTYKLTFDFETDETSGTIALARFYDGSSYTTLQTGSGSVEYYFTAANAGLALGSIELSPNQYVQFSNISLKEVGGAAVMTNMTTSDIQTDTPY